MSKSKHYIIEIEKSGHVYLWNSIASEKVLAALATGDCVGIHDEKQSEPIVKAAKELKDRSKI